MTKGPGPRSEETKILVATVELPGRAVFCAETDRVSGPHSQQPDIVTVDNVRRNPTKIALFPTFSSIKAQSPPFMMIVARGAAPETENVATLANQVVTTRATPARRTGPGSTPSGRSYAPSSHVGANRSRDRRGCERGSAKSKTPCAANRVLRVHTLRPALGPHRLAPPAHRPARSTMGTRRL